jgi:hypothetical protein
MQSCSGAHACLWSSIISESGLLYLYRLSPRARRLVDTRRNDMSTGLNLNSRTKWLRKSSDEIPSLAGGTATLRDVGGEFKVPLANRSI